MVNGWSMTTLEHVAYFRNGAGIKQKYFHPTGIPLARISDFTEDSIDVSNLIYVEKEHAKKWFSHRLKRGEILIATVGSWPPNWSSVVGKTIRVPLEAEGVIQNQNTCSIIAIDAHANQNFLYYLLKSKSFIFYASNAASGSANQARIPVQKLKNFEFEMPPMNEQTAIGHILHSLDIRIELNRQMNETLEAIAKAIFKSWFVDYDPVKAKMEGRKPYGMDEETAALFPDEFEDDDEFGRIPKGWETDPLDNIAEFLNGLALQKYPPTGGDDDVPVIKIAQLRKGDTEGSDYANIAQKPEYIVNDGDVIFSWSGSLMVKIWCGGMGALNQHLFKVTSEHYPKWFYYQWILKHMPEFQAIAEGKATTMGHIKRHHLNDAKVIVPPSDVLLKADELIKHLIEKKIENNNQSRTLISLRDTLLPKLISGEIRIKNPEKFVEAIP